MIRHVVLWQLAEQADGHDRGENARRIKRALEALRGRIPGLLEIEVGIGLFEEPDAAHVCLNSLFKDEAALAAYHDHPLHLAVKPLVAACRISRQVIDYRI